MDCLPLRHKNCYYMILMKVVVMQNLNREIRVFVDRLFPFHDFQNNPVVLPEVQPQDDSYNCPMAITIAQNQITSILFGIKPYIVIDLC